jgi:hypothetical protein
VITTLSCLPCNRSIECCGHRHFRYDRP